MVTFAQQNEKDKMKHILEEIIKVAAITYKREKPSKVSKKMKNH